MKNNNNERMKLPIWMALLPLLLLMAMLVFTIRAFGGDSLSGPSQIVMLAASAVCCIIGITAGKVKWHEFEAQIAKNISQVSSALIILLFIGALGGAWMVSGVVPMMIYYGLDIIHPSVFLASTCVISAVVSVMTGSSWTTIATIGVALMGIGKAQGFEEGWIAGAIISGSYFGDKISPLSDTTVLASSVCHVNLFSHIRYMMITTIPSFSIALMIFFVAGWSHTTTEMGHLIACQEAILGRYDINMWLLIVPAATAVMIVKKLPALVTMFASTLMGVVFALIFQPDVITEIADGDMFRGAMQAVYGGTSIKTADIMLDELVATRGMEGMLSTVWLILCAMCFGATMTAGGMTAGITRLFTRFARGRTSTVASTVATGLVLNTTVADQYMGILLSGNVFREIYDKNGLERRLLSRATEDSVTVTSVLIPWNSCGMTQSTVLGVATLTYLPYCFFNLLSPLMSIIIAITGYKVKLRFNN
ncbi:MAG: Na+/H+ antiporter NhaC family protein [Prevotellaceae bacterium]|nr:Na+/H+ antiporter NhaC family protein [Prevotellaceae bacterium]